MSLKLDTHRKSNGLNSVISLHQELGPGMQSRLTAFRTQSVRDAAPKTPALSPRVGLRNSVRTSGLKT